MPELLVFLIITTVFIGFYIRREEKKGRFKDKPHAYDQLKTPPTRVEKLSEKQELEAKEPRTIDWTKHVPESDYKPTCGTPYFHFPNNELAWTHNGTLLLDPEIGEVFKNMGKESFLNGLASFNHLAHLAGWADCSGGCRLEQKYWWDGDDNDTPAKYRPYVVFGVEPYGFEPDDEAEMKSAPNFKQVTLENPTPEELQETVDSFERITGFQFSGSVTKDGGDE